MALATDELIRKAQNTTTNVQALIPQIWAAELERNLRKRAVFEQSAVVNTDLLAPGAGDTVYIPILPDVGPAAALTEGTDMPLTSITNANSVALKPSEVGLTFEITRKALDRMKYDGAAALMDRLAYSMSQAIEGSFAALWNVVVPGTATKFDDLYPAGTSSTTIVATGADVFSDALLLAGIADLQSKNNVPFPDGYFRCYINPNQYKSLLLDANTRQDLRWAAPQRLLNGEIGALHGCRIIVTNYIQTDVENTSVTVNKAMLVAPRAFAVAYKRRPGVVVDPTLYDMGRRRRFGVFADYDIEPIHAERAVVLSSAGD